MLSVGEKRKRPWKWSGAGGHDTNKLCNVEAIDYKYKGLIGGILHRGEDEEEIRARVREEEGVDGTSSLLVRNGMYNQDGARYKA